MRGNINESSYEAENFSHWASRGSESLRELQKQKNSSPEHTKFPNQIIKGLPQEELSRFLSIGKVINLSAGENVYQFGDRLDYVYFPLSAVFAQLHVLENGKMCETALIGREGCLGLRIAPGFSVANANYWIETVVTGTAWKACSRDFNRAFDKDSVIRIKINQYFNFFTEQLLQKIVCNCFHSIKEKFCSRLLILQKACLKNTIPGTQENIARSLGTQRPSVSCIASQLQKENVIKCLRGQISILDREKLESVSCGCHTIFEEYSSLD